MLALLVLELRNVADGLYGTLLCCQEILQLSATIHMALWPAQHQTFVALETHSH